MLSERYQDAIATDMMRHRRDGWTYAAEPPWHIEEKLRSSKVVYDERIEPQEPPPASYGDLLPSVHDATYRRVVTEWRVDEWRTPSGWLVRRAYRFRELGAS